MELATRYSGEQDLINKIFIYLLNISKTSKLHTMFSRAGLEKTIKTLTSDPDLFSFILDLTDVFRSHLINVDYPNFEDKMIKHLSTTMVVDKPSQENKYCLLSEAFYENFSTSEDVENLIKSNKWLLTIVLIRFCNFYTLQPKTN